MAVGGEEDLHMFRLGGQKAEEDGQHRGRQPVLGRNQLHEEVAGRKREKLIN